MELEVANSAPWPPADSESDPLAAAASASPSEADEPRRQSRRRWTRGLLATAGAGLLGAAVVLGIRWQRQGDSATSAAFEDAVRLTSDFFNQNNVTASDVRAYQEYLAKYGKEDYNPALRDLSMERRFVAFKINYDFIKEENAKKGNATFGENSFTDLPENNFRAYKLGLLDSKSLAQSQTFPRRLAGGSWLGDFFHNGQNLPTEVNWLHAGAVTDVKDQQECGSCYTFSSIAALEGAWKIATGVLMSLSNQEGLDCSAPYGNQGCNGGTLGWSFDYLAHSPTCTWSNYPYLPAKGKVGKCRQSSCQVAVPEGNVIGYRNVIPLSDNSLLGAILQQPVSVAISANSIAFKNYKSGIITRAACNERVDHAVLVVGYGKGLFSASAIELPYYYVKNSWGTTWGEQGYVKIERGPGVNDDPTGVCGILAGPYFPVIKDGAVAPDIVPEGPPEKEDASCFPGTARVRVLGKGECAVHTLRVGDRALVRRGDSFAYEPVLGFIHAVRGGATNGRFMVVEHERGEFRASENHLVFVRRGDRGEEISQMVAQVRPGDRLIALVHDTDGVEASTCAVTGNCRILGSTIIGVRQAKTDTGLYAPLLAAGTLVVDDVVVSTYGSPSIGLHLSHGVAHGVFFSFRAYYAAGLNRALAPFWNWFCSSSVTHGSDSKPWFCKGEDWYGREASVDEVHPFAHFAQRILRLDKLLPVS
eukprot:TRINITY_DN72033_c0_g1_i1.p1 TRINITY_DN72033_c0_g1~~TRINITY_DN72033_c0_g1_i1.p1  ORF type:complete len:703 (-),score=109.02 TRINITY_DN72033_c0_g1_i1:402-2510(-)